jgi:cold shock protein
MLGTIKKKVLDKGFGFITPEQGGEDLFFHFSAIEGGVDTFESVEAGQKVEFDVINGRKPGSKQASNITLA